jgi:methylmalonyl-CoA mutase cobalamin-binding subunit
MVLTPPGDGRLRPVHELGLCRHNGVHLHLVPKVIPFVFARGGKDVILLDIH